MATRASAVQDLPAGRGDPIDGYRSANCGCTWAGQDIKQRYRRSVLGPVLDHH